MQAYPGAPESGNVKHLRKRLRGFDLVVYGDNHMPFEVKGARGPTIFNCGCLIPRKIDERKHKPSVGLLYEDGCVTRHYLDVSKDRWVDTESKEAGEAGVGVLEDFLDGLSELDSDSFDFRDAVNRFLEGNEVGEGAKRILLELLEG